MNIKISGAPAPTFRTENVFVDVQHNGSPQEQKEYVAIVNEQSHKVMNVFSERYELVQHKDVLDCMKEALGYMEFDCTMTISPHYVGGGARMIADVMFPKKFNAAPNARKGDILDFGIRVINSVDGSKAVTMMPMSIRLVCTNGMTHTEFAKAISVKHLTGAKSLIADFRTPMIETLENFNAITEQYRSWIERAVDLLKIDEQCAKKGIVMPKRMHAYVEEHDVKTAWDLFNAMTAYNTHERDVDEGNKLFASQRIMEIMSVVQ